ncbi:MAG TPA: hypothetical protein VFK68_01470 [Propionibacteriaceae bacterium]|nr:hypothetical protein [Propionibacteriaceae bacterium]
MTSASSKKWILGSAAGLALGGALVAGLASAASADSTGTPSAPTTSASTGSTASTGTDSTRTATQDTAVTGDEATKVSAAVTAKDSAVTVASVRKDPDGSYDVLGTKAGANVMFDVSADLATVTQAQGGGGKGGGASSDTPVTGDEATKVSAAVTAKDSAVTVSSVRKDPDGSYDVLGSKAGANVFFDVSADLGTVTLHS